MKVPASSNPYCGKAVRQCSPQKAKKNVLYNPYSRKTFRVTNVNGINITSEVDTIPVKELVTQSPITDPSKEKVVRNYFFGTFRENESLSINDENVASTNKSEVIDLRTPEKTERPKEKYVPRVSLGDDSPVTKSSKEGVNI